MAPARLAELLFLLPPALSLIIALNARRLGDILGVIDHPDHIRKHHREPTPLVGGLAILLPLLGWIACAKYFIAGVDVRLMLAILTCGAGVGIVGLSDDQSRTTPLARTAFLLIFLAIAFIIDPGLIAHVMRWGDVPAVSIGNWEYYLLMSVTAVGLINAVNMADGQSGIVTGMFVIWPACLALLGSPTISAIALVILAAALCVFVFNLRGKLFLGTCGSYGVTFVLGLLTAAAHAQGVVSLATVIVWFSVPVMDCVRLTISRPLRGVSPFKGGRDHFHHRLQDRLGVHAALVAYVGVVALTSIVATLFPHLAVFCVIGLTGFYFSFAWPREVTAPALDLRAIPPHLGNVVALERATFPAAERRISRGL